MDYEGGVNCRLYSKAQESVGHILSGCSALAQSKYISQHDSALKVLFYKMLQDLRIIDEISPWYSLVKPKPIYASEDVIAHWDVSVFAEHQESKRSKCPSYQQQDQASDHTGDERAMGEQQGKDG